MEMPFEFEADEVAAVMRAVHARMAELSRQPATDENYQQMQSLRRFLRKMKPVITAGKAEASENIGRLN